MNNYHPEGYSVAEVAQILGMNPCTVRFHINEGHLKANTNGQVQKGHRRRIRITREQLAEYMMSRKGLYKSNPMFDKLCGSVKSTDSSSKPEPSEYTVSDISELTGAWAPQNLERKQDEVDIATQDTAPVAKKTTESQAESFSLLIDGRISIGNVGRDTMIKIVDALLSDGKFSPSEMTINFR